jgi:hypothetical protein
MSKEYVTRRLAEIADEHRRRPPRRANTAAQTRKRNRIYDEYGCVVYVLAVGDLVKVGVAQDVAERIKALRCANPLIGEPAYVSRKLAFAYGLEARIHRTLKEFSVGGEWFRFDAAEAVALTERLEAEYDDVSYRG